MAWTELRLVLLGCGALVVAGCVAAVDAADGTSAALRAQLGVPASVAPPGAVAPRPQRSSDFADLYARRGFRPLWVEGDRITPQAEAVVGVLEQAPTRGLRPEDYDAASLRARVTTISRSGTSDADRARFDVDLTGALGRFLHDLHVGRAPPRRALLSRDGRPKRIDLDRVIPEVAVAPEPERRIAAVEPRIGVYRRLKDALARLRDVASTEPEPAVGDLPVLHPGDVDPGVPVLRERLIFLGDLPSTDATGGDRYDPATVRAVRQFQHRHGLDPDGVVGEKTLRQLRVPLSRRIRQIELSLERLRWVPDDLSPRVLIVNIPEFELHGVHHGEAAVDFRSKVVVGSAVRARQTPVLRAEMTRVIFHPYWNVPTSIARGELAPKERRSPGALARDGFELVSSSGAVLPITSRSIAGLGSGRVRLRQRPGSDNALGLVKFEFPNPNHVYLHDTPAKSLFGRSRRDFSHGCIRVADPAGLAEFVLRPQGFDRDRVDRVMASSQRQVVPVDESISVLLFYTTAVVQRGGEVRFLDDIYGLDAELDRELRRPPS